MDKVSVVIPTYNRFKYLLNAIISVKAQTYKNIEIIVVNDGSTQDEYYKYDFKKNFGDNFYILHLPRNSKEIYGHPCQASVRNIGMMLSNGKYIAFLDDDDIFLPSKIEKQVSAMKQFNWALSCSEAYQGKGIYNPSMKYDTMHYNGACWRALQEIFNHNNKLDLLYKMYCNEIGIWGEEELSVHNCTVGGSTIIMEKKLIKKAGYFPTISYGEDYKYWKKLVKYSRCVFLREPLSYIDLLHGDGINYDGVKD